jgi:hypothetical protein
MVNDDSTHQEVHDEIDPDLAFEAHALTREIVSAMHPELQQPYDVRVQDNYLDGI